MIHVIATIELQPGRREAFLQEFQRLVPLVRAEEGCLEYGPAIDLPTDIAAQPAAREDVVTMLEEWEDLEALERHLVAPHMVQYRETVKPLVVSTELQVLAPV